MASFFLLNSVFSKYNIYSRCCLVFLLLVSYVFAQDEIFLNSGRPTFTEPSVYVSIPGKIVLEEHSSTDLFNAAFTFPFHNLTNEILYGLPIYQTDVQTRLNSTDLTERVRQMDIANISISIISLVPPGIQGIFNASFAISAATTINNQLHTAYTTGNFSNRFAFFCNVALQEPVTAATELERCITTLNGVGVMMNGYTNIGSVNNVRYLDDPLNEPFWAKVEELNVPVYIHARMPPPNQQRVYEDFNFLAGSPWGFGSETAAHALRLMVSGLFDRHPNLKIILGHCGEGIPFVLSRIDQRMRHFQHTLWPAERTMTEYWEDNFWVTTAGVQSQATLIDTLRVSGEDHVLFSVDYPFEDDLEIAGWFDRLELNSKTKRKIASGNARALMKLPGN